MLGSAYPATAQEDPNVLCQVTNPQPGFVGPFGWLTRCGDPSDIDKQFAIMLVEPASGGGHELLFEVAGHGCAEDRHEEGHE